MLEPTNQSELQFRVWERAVQTQMHFNEMSVRSRQLGLTYVVAALGLAVVTIFQFEDAFVTFDRIRIHLSAFIILAAALGVFGVWTLDLGVYHRMLRGAVKFGRLLEERGFAKNAIGVPAGMTEYITMYSQHEDVTPLEDGTFETGKKISAATKVKRFYAIVIISLLVMAALIAIVIK